MRSLKLSPSALVVAATLLATFLRFFHLSTLAPEAWFDEVWFALRARELLQGPAFVVFYETPWGGGNALMVYLTAVAQLFGFTGISSSRLASAALGVIAVPLAYACFREMLRQDLSGGRIDEAGAMKVLRAHLTGLKPRWAAALAAFVLAYLLHWVIISRVGTEPSLAPAAALFCVWQLKRAKRNLTTENTERTEKSENRISVFSVLSVVKSYWGYVMVGLVAGLAQYNGPHARFILPLLAFITLHDFLNAHTPIRPNLLRGYTLTALSALLIAAPLILFFIQNPEWLLARARITTSTGPLNDPAVLRSNLYFTAIAFNFVGSFDPLTNYPGRPMFDVVQSVGWFVGHGWALWNLRRSASARELLAWEAIMLLPTLLTADAPNFQRMIGYAAPAAALVAIGWFALALWLYTRLISLSPCLPFSLTPLLRLLGFWISRVFCGPGLVLGVFYHSHTLLIRYPQLSILPVSYLHIPVRDARELIARAENGERVLVSLHPEDVEAQNDVIAFEYLFPGHPIERLDFRQCLPLTSDRKTRTNYLVLTRGDKVSVVNLYNAYPESKITAAYYWQNSGTWIELPPGTAGPPPPNPGHARFDPGLTFAGYEWSGDSVAVGQSLFITLWWKVETDLAADYTSFIHVGTGLDGAVVVAQRDGQPCQSLFPTSRWRAGDLIRDSFAITFPSDAPPGQYPLAVGWYTFPDFVRLPLLEAGTPLPDDRAIIGYINVTP